MILIMPMPKKVQAILRGHREEVRLALHRGVHPRLSARKKFLGEGSESLCK